MKKRVLTLLLLTAFFMGVSSGAPTVAYAGDNAAIAVNTKDGTTVFKVAFAIRHVMQDVVDDTNGAVAYASCTDCVSVAIAFEIVLIEGDSSVITPTNLAFAFNENCDTCVAVAQAYQFVFGNGSAVHFDAEGNRILSELRRRLHSLRKEDLTLEKLQAELDEIAAGIRDVLANHLVPTGPSKNQGDTPETTTAVTTTTTTPTSTTPTTTEETTTTTPTTTEVTTTTGP